MRSEPMSPEPRPLSDVRPIRRLARWRRYVAAALVVSVFAMAGYSLALFPRLRFLFTAVPVLPASHELAAIANSAMTGTLSAAGLDSAASVVAEEVRRGGFAGAALGIGEGPRPLRELGVGRTTWSRLAAPVDADQTVYDIASLTKLMTTMAVMVLMEDGKLKLDDRVSRWVPEFRGEDRDRVTVRQLLTHTSGLQAGVLGLEGSSPERRLDNLIREARLVDEPGATVLYSDVGFILLGEVVRRAAGAPLPEFLERRVWGPLGMNSTGYQPGPDCAACAPTLSREDGTPFVGQTHDPLSRALGGVTGNAGVFSTGHDMGRFAAMLANGGELDGARIVTEATLREFARPQPGAGTRGLGFEFFCGEGTVPNDHRCREPYAFGHTGYTGTSLWIDPVSGVWVVLLSNRTYLPEAPNRIRWVRRRLFELVTGRAGAEVAEGDTAS